MWHVFSIPYLLPSLRELPSQLLEYGFPQGLPLFSVFNNHQLSAVSQWQTLASIFEKSLSCSHIMIKCQVLTADCLLICQWCIGDLCNWQTEPKIILPEWALACCCISITITSVWFCNIPIFYMVFTWYFLHPSNDSFSKSFSLSYSPLTSHLYSDFSPIPNNRWLCFVWLCWTRCYNCTLCWSNIQYVSGNCHCQVPHIKD